MKDILIKINPKFKKLNNPVLRRTLAKIAGVRQAAAVVGGMEPIDLLNQLRAAVGQRPVAVETAETPKEAEKNRPTWITEVPKEIINANELLDKDDNPLAKSFTVIRKFNEGEVLAIESDFQPEPLIEEFEKKGHDVYSQEMDKDKFMTYVKK